MPGHTRAPYQNLLQNWLKQRELFVDVNREAADLTQTQRTIKQQGLIIQVGGRGCQGVF